MSGSLCRPPQTKILRTDSSDCMYVMNCVEVEITSPEEAFEVLFKGKTATQDAGSQSNSSVTNIHLDRVNLFVLIYWHMFLRFICCMNMNSTVLNSVVYHL